MILAGALSDFAIGLSTVVIVAVQIGVGIAIAHRLAKVSDILSSRHALIVPDELGPDDRIVVWHKDSPAGESSTPDSPAGEQPDRKPIVGLE